MAKHNHPTIIPVYSSLIGNVTATVWYCNSEGKETYQTTVTRNLIPGDSTRSTQSFDAGDLDNLRKATIECERWLDEKNGIKTLSPIPGRMRGIDTIDPEAREAKKSFFAEVRALLQQRYGDGVTHPSKIELKSGELAYGGENALESQVTNDRVTYLTHDNDVVAAVFALRDDFNATRFVFFRNLEGLVDPKSKE